VTSANIVGGDETASVSALMWPVVLALLAPVLAQTWFFGFGVLTNVAVAVTGSWVLESLVLKLRQRHWRGLTMDGSVTVTAALLALALPPDMPLWQLLLGLAFAVVVAKHCYGGVGRNVFNPAMAGYAFIIISFPASLTSWTVAATAVDATTAATPLAALRSEGSAHVLSSTDLQDTAWLVINFAYLVGGIVLLWARACTLDLPVALIIGLLLASALTYATGAGAWTPWMHLTSGASLCAAFFIVTDPVTAPNLPVARLVYGALAGALMVAIREFGDFPDGVAFAVLLANAGGPALDEIERRMQSGGAA
jgi:Na+-translocating ferredoxin:NAD+ oxidoreductase subunit D